MDSHTTSDGNQDIVMGVLLRNLKPRDCPLLERLLSRIKEFSEEDESLAMELIHHALSNRLQSDYDFFIAAGENDFPVGYACFGPTPLTQGTFDLYWIAVDPAFSGHGIGTALLEAIEEKIKRLNGRMLIIETSSGQSYESSRRFYVKNGYQRSETIRDFFQNGEDRVTYTKRFR
jgi:ribosomal protein S18 acetylase RimI-like enzyme